MGVSLLPSITVAALLAVILQVFVFSPLSSPESLSLPDTSPHYSSIPVNTRRQSAIKLGEGLLRGPEDICVDEGGFLYAATRDGWIKRLRKGESSWEDWVFVDNSSLLGITARRHGGLIVCDTDKGLLEVDKCRMTVLATKVGHSPIRFADDVIESLDGRVYFSVASTKYMLNWYLDVLEARPSGQLLKYDPSTNESTILLNNLGFANGVTLSKDEDFIVVCLTWKFRCVKYWLKGEKAGETEVFIENLPGGPDNINLAPDGPRTCAPLLEDSPVVK